MIVHDYSPSSWDLYFMEMARLASTRTKCVSRAVGAVLVKDNRVIATGYNGPPEGSQKCHNKVCIWPREQRPSPTDLSKCPAVHAETNTLYQAARIGVPTKGATIYLYCPVACKDCAGALINAGVREMVVMGRIPTNEYYDTLSKEYVEDENLLNVRVIHPTKEVASGSEEEA